MEIITSLKKFHSLDKPCVIALGTFDGLHRGHQDVIGAAKEYALKHGSRLAVFTFSNHPFSLIRPDETPVSLIGSREKYGLLEKMGVDLLLEVPFDQQLAALAPSDFIRQLTELNFDCLVVGENFNFGWHGEGNSATLKSFADAMDFHLIVRQLVSDNDTVISSTEIRRLIEAGEIERANKMLGRPYTLTGIVVQGCQRGRLLDFPTANIELDAQQEAVPHKGVYAVRASVKGKLYYGMANIGMNPTFGDIAAARLETNLFDFKSDIYGCHMTVQFHKFLRCEQKFASVQELQKQLAEDKARCRDFFGI